MNETKNKKHELCILGAWIFTGTLDECRKEYFEQLKNCCSKNVRQQMRKTMTIWEINSD